MCVAVYVASSHPLLESVWNETAPRVYSEAVKTTDAAINQHFTKPHIYYVGASSGCGCNFKVGLYGDLEKPDDIDKAIVDRHQFVAFLKDALKLQSEVEVFVCWEGDQGDPAERKKVATDTFLIPEPFDAHLVYEVAQSHSTGHGAT